MCHSPFARQTTWLFFLWLSLVSLNYGQASPADDAAASVQVRLTVTVAGENGYPAVGLRREHFMLFSNKAQQEIAFFHDQPEPASIVFLLDASGSVDPEIMRLPMIKAIRDFVAKASEENEYALIGFNQRAQVLCGWTRDSQTFSAGLGAYHAMPKKGQTALYDAVGQGLELAQRGAHPKRILIIVSDGSDNASEVTNLRKLRKAARTQDALIYGINLQYVYESRPGQFTVVPGGNQEPLTELAKDTGGWMYLVQGQYELQGALERVLLQLRAQYTLGFNPNPTTLADGQWHPLELKLKLSPSDSTQRLSLMVRHRAGFVLAKP